MGKRKGRKLNPADAYRKKQRQRELQRHRRERQEKKDKLKKSLDVNKLKSQLDEIARMEREGTAEKKHRVKRKQLLELLRTVAPDDNRLKESSQNPNSYKDGNKEQDPFGIDRFQESSPNGYPQTYPSGYPNYPGYPNFPPGYGYPPQPLYPNQSLPAPPSGLPPPPPGAPSDLPAPPRPPYEKNDSSDDGADDSKPPLPDMPHPDDIYSASFISPPPGIEPPPGIAPPPGMPMPPGIPPFYGSSGYAPLPGMPIPNYAPPTGYPPPPNFAPPPGLAPPPGIPPPGGFKRKLPSDFEDKESTKKRQISNTDDDIDAFLGEMKELGVV